MLHKEAVESTTLDILNRLQSKEYLEGFYLAGGTGLALQFGHRRSLDIDLFSNFNFDVDVLLENLNNDFDFHLFLSAKNTIKGSINNVQVDILAHRYSLVSEPVKLDNIIVLSLQDIAAMKLNAISTSGQRVKDFIDVYYLLREFSMADLIEFYKVKYEQNSVVNVLKSIVYFNDVDLADWPQMIADPDLKWDDVKKRIVTAMKNYLDSSNP